MKPARTFAIPLVLILVCGWLFRSAYVEVKNRAIDHLNEQQLVLAETAARGIESFFEHYTQLLTELSKMSPIASFDDDGKELMKILYLTHARDIKGITRVSASGRILYTFPETPGTAGADLSNQEHIRRILESHKPVVSDVFESVQGFASIALHVPVFEGETFHGSLGLLIPFEHLSRKYLDPVKAGEGGYAWMISRKGVELFSPFQGHTGKSVSENYKNSPKIVSMAEEMIQGKQGRTTYLSKRVRGEGLELVRNQAIYLPVHIGDTFWSIVVATPEEEALGIIQGFKDRWLLIIGLLMLITVLWTAYALRAFRILKEEEKRKHAEAALKASEEKYRELVENANSIILRLDAGGRVTFLNEFAEKFFGFTKGEIVGRHVVGTIVPPTESGGRDLGEMIERLVQDPNAYVNNENENMRRDGERVWIAWTNKPVYDEDGQVREVLCIGNDVTERKRLDEERALLATVVEQAEDNVLVTDERRTIFYVNPAFERSSGYRSDELKGRKLKTLRSARHDETFYRNMKDTLDHGGVWAGVIINRGKDGTDFEIEGTISPLRDATGAVTHFVAVGRDTSRFRKLERELQQAQKMESVGRLAGGVAHDFNNMLAVILGHAELGLNQIDATQPVYNNLQEILKASHRSANLIRQLLAFARKQTISPRVLDINETVGNMLKMVRRLIGENIELLWKPGRDLWPVKLDPAQIDQIMANLCVNARDAITGVGKITIATGNTALDERHCREHAGAFPGEYVRLTVSDDGCGMEKDVLDKLFEPFFTTKEIGKGTGLGLATVYGIVKQNGGFLEVWSEPGLGTTFHVYLPRADVAVSEEPRFEEKSQKLMGTETILVVEDEKSILELGKKILEQHGYRVLAAQHPVEALRMVKDYPGRIDLLVTDVIMPEMNGKELLERLHAIRNDIKALFMSGYTDDFIAQHGVLDKEVHFLQKPFSVQTLVEKVREALDG